MNFFDDLNNDELNNFLKINKDIKKKKKKKKKSKYNEEYTFDTIELYKSMRKLKIDPIMNVETKESNRFEYYNMWDPLTGEILEKDPYGSLCFDTNYLLFTFYSQRLNNLWVRPVDEEGGYYSGFYDSGVGAGEDCLIVGRGFHPEKYLFRLPIVDCYLTKDHNYQFITMGPKLNQKQIFEINNKINKESFVKIFKNEIPLHKYNSFEIPDLTLIKSCYDIAIKKDINDINDLKGVIIKILFISIKSENIYKKNIEVNNKISLFKIIRERLHNLINLKGFTSLEYLKLKSSPPPSEELSSIIEGKWIFMKNYENLSKESNTLEGTEEDFYKNVIKLSKKEPNHINLKKQFLTIINRVAVDILVYM